MHNQLIRSSHIRISCFRFPRSPVNIPVIIRIPSLGVLYLPVYWHVPHVFLTCSSHVPPCSISSTWFPHDFPLWYYVHVPHMFLRVLFPVRVFLTISRYDTTCMFLTCSYVFYF